MTTSVKYTYTVYQSLRLPHGDVKCFIETRACDRKLFMVMDGVYLRENKKKIQTIWQIQNCTIIHAHIISTARVTYNESYIQCIIWFISAYWFPKVTIRRQQRMYHKHIIMWYDIILCYLKNDTNTSNFFSRNEASANVNNTIFVPNFQLV